MDPLQPNEYGLTHTAGITDMSGALPLEEQLQNARIPFSRVELPMGAFGADQVSIISYNRPNDGMPVSILVVPQAGPDCWAEEYFYFVGTDLDTMCARNWPAIIDDLRHIAYPRFYGQK